MSNSGKPKEKVARFFPDKLDPDKYNLIATKATLAAVQLISNDFDIKPMFFSKNDEVKLELGYDVLTLDFYDHEAAVAGIFRYEVLAKVGRKHVLSTRADFMSVYDVPEGSAEYEAKAFCARVGLFAAYPYFRALYAHLTSVANADLPTLPVLSADPLKKKSGKQVARRLKDNQEKANVIS